VIATVIGSLPAARRRQINTTGCSRIRPTERSRAKAAGITTTEGRRLYARRAGIEGTISQGVRAFGLRRSRYRGLAKTRLQHVATAAAINIDRLAAWFRAVPRTATRISRFAAIAA